MQPSCSSWDAKQCERPSGCEDGDEGDADEKTPKSLQCAHLNVVLREDAAECLSSGGGTRTPDTRIMIPLL